MTLGGTVYAMAVQGDGKIVLGGFFTTYNGVSRHGIARVNSDGSLDPTFNPGAGVSGVGVNIVYALALQGDGKIVVGGQFGSYNGVSYNGIVRVNSDGSLDNSFNSGSGIGTNPNRRIRGMAMQSDGKILVAGAFITYNGTARNGLARANTDGALDPSFDPGAGSSNTIATLLTQSDGRILVGGIQYQQLHAAAGMHRSPAN